MSDEINPIIELTETSFQAFIDDERNSQLVTDNKYGVHELVDESWVTKEIEKADYVNYNHAALSDDFMESREYTTLNSAYTAYPFVVAK